MVPSEITKAVLELPFEDRLDLARRLIESMAAPATLNEAVTEGIRRLEDMANGRVDALTEEQFRAALK